MSVTLAPYRAAIIGTGRIGSLLERDPLRPRPHTHAGWYTADARTTIAAACDVDAERLAAFGTDWSVPSERLYGDYRLMLERERPDVVSVCAYAVDRTPMCLAALQAGARGLWIEKAVACAVDDAESLARAVTATGAVAVVDHPRRLEPRYRAVDRWVRQTTFGALETVHVLFSGHVVHTGTHAWDLLLAWCGPWCRVEATLDSASHEAAASGDDHDRDEADVARYTAALGPGERDRGGRARIVFESGVEAFVTGGAKSYFVFQCDLVCTRGRIRIGNDVWEVLAPAESPRYTGYRELAPIDAAAHMIAADHRPSSVLGELLEAMSTGTPGALSIDAATDALALGVAVMQAGLTGRPVTPATLDRSLRIASI
jgi:predicted dehydrogenase